MLWGMIVKFWCCSFLSLIVASCLSLSIALTGLTSLKLSVQQTETWRRERLTQVLDGRTEDRREEKRLLKMREDRLVVVSSLERFCSGGSGIVDH